MKKKIKTQTPDLMFMTLLRFWQYTLSVCFKYSYLMELLNISYKSRVQGLWFVSSNVLFSETKLISIGINGFSTTHSHSLTYWLLRQFIIMIMTCLAAADTSSSQLECHELAYTVITGEWLHSRFSDAFIAATCNLSSDFLTTWF